MTVDLEDTLHWSSAAGDTLTMLQQLQPNILKGHVRDHLSVLFLHFDVEGEGRAFLRAVHTMMKSAKKHLDEVQQFKIDGTDGTPYVGVGLTAAGYAALGVTTVPGDARFAQPGGMKGSRAGLQDPVVSTWDPAYRGEIHAVVLVGDAQNHQQRYEATRHAVLGHLTDGISVLGEELGRSLLNADGHGIEHFGYVDGRSQPLFLDEDIKDETDEQDGTDNWDPAFPLKQVIVEDPAAPDPSVHFGSYFVFRKLEQNVALFNQGENELADRLGLTGPDRKRAGAMLVGRFEDGTPLTLQNDAGSHEPSVTGPSAEVAVLLRPQGVPARIDALANLRRLPPLAAMSSAAAVLASPRFERVSVNQPDPVSPIYRFDDRLGDRLPETSRFQYVAVSTRDDAYLVTVPWPWRGVRAVDILVNQRQSPTGSPVSVAVHHTAIGGGLGYLAAGALDKAAALFGDAERMLWGKVRDPLGAAAGAYVLIGTERSGLIKNWDGWLVNLRDWFPDLSDGAILWGARRLRTAQTRAERVEAREALLEGYRRGLPVYTLGLSWLIEGLSAFPGDAECEAAALATRRLCWQVDMREPFVVLRLGGAR